MSPDQILSGFCRSPADIFVFWWIWWCIFLILLCDWREEGKQKEHRLRLNGPIWAICSWSERCGSKFRSHHIWYDHNQNLVCWEFIIANKHKMQGKAIGKQWFLKWVYNSTDLKGIRTKHTRNEQKFKHVCLEHIWNLSSSITHFSFDWFHGVIWVNNKRLDAFPDFLHELVVSKWASSDLARTWMFCMIHRCLICICVPHTHLSRGFGSTAVAGAVVRRGLIGLDPV